MDRTTRLTQRMDQAKSRFESVLGAAWKEIGDVFLLATGLFELVAGWLSLQTAAKYIPNSGAFLSIPALLIGGGLAVTVAGLLTLIRRRRALLHRLLGALTTGTFGFALAMFSRQDSDAAGDAFLTLAIVLGGCLLATLVFEDRIRE
jgi:cation transport ATPase